MKDNIRIGDYFQCELFEGVKMNKYEERRKEIRSTKNFDEIMKQQEVALKSVFPFLVAGAIVAIVSIFYVLC